MTFSHHLLSILFLIAALACYTVALPAGGTFMLLCGVILEVIFWYRISRSIRIRKPSTNQ
ncbi:MAG: hypothetical protein CMI00_12885 [Oceanospirillaceae bacterium]|nr:hypothetical protein [Oceanospirillaceae bacterium]